MKKNSFRIMLVIGITLGFIIGSFASAWKVGTDSSGQIWGWNNNDQGYITGPNGKGYVATNAGLQEAISDTTSNGNGLNFWEGNTISINDDITITSTLRPKNNTILDFQNHVATLAANVDFINLSNTGHVTIKNLLINISDATYTSTLITLYATGTNRCDFNTFENIRMNPSGVVAGAKFNYNGIKLYMKSCSNQIWQNVFQDITLWYVDKGIWLKASGTGGSGYQNIFQDVMVWQFIHGMIYFDVDNGVTHAFYRNSFTNVKGEAYSGSLYGVYNISDSGNIFFDCHIWDWTVSAFPSNPSWILAGNGSVPSEYAVIDFVGSTVDSIDDNGFSTSIRSSVNGYRNIDLNNSMYSPVRTDERYLLLNLPLNEGIGNIAYDKSRSAMDGTRSNGNWSNTTDYGTVFSFDNKSSYIRLLNNTNLDLSDNFTISWWMNWKGVEAGSTDYIFSTTKSTSYGTSLRVSSSGTFNLRVTDNGEQYVVAAGVSDLASSGIYNEWAHVAVVYTSPTSAEMYINGRIFDTTVTITHPGAASHFFMAPVLGALGNGASGFFNGNMSNFRIYNKALSQDEVRSDWLLGGSGERDLSGYMISSSLGGFYPASQSGLQQAINDVGNTSGSVKFPEGQKLTTTGTIYVWENVSVDMGWAQVIPTGDYDVFRIYRKSRLENIFFNLTTGPLSNSSACIRPYGVYAGAWEEFDSERQRQVRHIFIMGTDTGVNRQKGIGILFYPSASCTSPAAGIYEDIAARYINCTIRMKVDTAQYVNFNTFRDIKGIGNAYHIWMTDSANEISMNTFYGVKYEAEPILNEHYPIYLQGDCNYNSFYIDGFMDWAADGETTDYIRLADNDVDYNMFYGYFSAAPSLVTDLGDFNIFYGNDMKMTGSTTNGINVTNINPTGAGGTSLSNGVNFFKSTDGNPFIRLYGDVSGTPRAGLFRIDTSGKLEISTLSSDGGIDFEPGTARVNLTSILRLTPRASAPTSPSEGDIYVNSATHNIYCYLNGGWEQLDP